MYAHGQDYKEKEIILVDDGSNAVTKKVIKETRSVVDKLITQENLGVSAARNNGIKRATGDYILVWDSDDYFEKDFVSKAVKELKKKDVVIVTCYSRWFAEQSKNETIFEPRGGDINDALYHNVAMGSSLFRKNDWEKVGGYDENMRLGYEDWEFYIRLLKDGGKVRVLPEVLFHYRNSPGSRNKKANLKKFELLEYIYLKHQELYKEHFPLFIKNCLLSLKNSEAFKEQVMDSPDYRIGKKILKPFRVFGFFKKR